MYWCNGRFNLIGGNGAVHSGGSVRTTEGRYYCIHHSQIHPIVRSSYMDGTRAGLSRVPLGPEFTDMLNGSYT